MKKKKIETLYTKIGKKIYNDYEKNKLTDSSLTKYCKEISEIKYKILSIKKKILKAQSKKLCPLCGHEVRENALYCEHCGFKQKNKKKS